MPELVEHVAYLSQEIGPRPAGTEEEQQAALYITEQLQKEAGLSAVIEDFNSASGNDEPRVLCCVVTLAATVLSLFVPAFSLPAVALTLLAAVLYAAEAFGRPVLSRLFARGVSQNVVAKYEPGYTAETGGTRRRKVVLVSRYDSGRVRPELNGVVLSAMPGLIWANLGAMIFIPVLLLVRGTLFQHAVGVAEILFNVLTVFALILAVLPLVLLVTQRLSSYNEGANCNASGTAVLLEVARRVGRGRVSEAELAARTEASLHGEEAVRASGLVPEGAQLVYEATQVKAPNMAPQSPESRLASAKAAVAALSGKPVSGVSASDIAQNLVQIKEPPLPSPSDEAYRELRDETREAFAPVSPETVQAAFAASATPQDVRIVGSDGLEFSEAGQQVSDAAAMAGSGVASTGVEAASASMGIAGGIGAAAPFSSAFDSQPSDGDVPDWFKNAQERAKKPVQAAKPAQRSRYASALDAAVAESSGYFAEANDAVTQEAEERLDARRDEIHEVKAPQWAKPSPSDYAEADAGTAVGVSVPAATDSYPVPGEGAAVPGRLPFAASSREIPSEPLPGASSSNDVPGRRAATAQASEDPFATTALPPIDVADLRLDGVPPISDVPMPSFLDPRTAQREAQSALSEQPPRTANRVDVTGARIADSGRIEDVPVDDSLSDTPADASDATSHSAGRRPIVLPDVGVSSASHVPLSELSKQRAPLAEAETSGGKTVAKSLLNMLPAIDLADPASADNHCETPGIHPSGPSNASLRSSLPSLSGAISGKGTVPEASSSSVSLTGSFLPAGATGTFAPVGDELIENVDPDDIYIDDADDSAYGDNFTETGAFAGPGYVEMPKSRVQRFFDRFRRKGKDEEASPQEWLEVDESFDARTAGAERGGWESFREDGEDYASEDRSARSISPDGVDTAYEGFEEDSFTGYADQEEQPYYDEDFDPDDVSDEDGFSSGGRGGWQGGAFSRMRVGRVDTRSSAEEEDDDGLDAASLSEPEAPQEMKQIYQFRNPDINTEVWFVALGSELADHSGIRAFLDEHQQDLRGSIIVDLDALGAGSLSMVEREGAYRKAKTSSRMKRYIKKASQATGISVDSAQIGWQDSAASYAIKRGFQAMHLVGMEGAKPALFAQGDDVLENIDEETLGGSADFVMELLKNI